MELNPGHLQHCLTNVISIRRLILSVSKTDTVVTNFDSENLSFCFPCVVLLHEHCQAQTPGLRSQTDLAVSHRVGVWQGTQFRLNTADSHASQLAVSNFYTLCTILRLQTAHKVNT